ncbi:putative LRR receptor-like serine/threonine-protein kinase [Hibiscus syriacus]|uniref:LRR receptor-like serine/threonine-protein kinase n=1 Tax=Hibiscus syriacus TaxID=106335 RepID=A0A6A2ZG75_HIBSY|nr:putative LRR receptor-like serine/threonine-protein kinase [Hibiscus syriacus]
MWQRGAYDRQMLGYSRERLRRARVKAQEATGATHASGGAGQKKRTLTTLDLHETRSYKLKFSDRNKKNKTMLEDKANSWCSTVILRVLLLITGYGLLILNLFFGFAAVITVSGNSLNTDKGILLNLKSFLEKQNRVNRGRYSEWNLRSSNPCEWHGIFCSPDMERVTGVDLSDSKISGEMFNNFSALTQLQHLDLSRNTLKGAIPDDINRCHNLVYLNLSHNILGAELKLTELTNLQKLDLSTNRFHGEINFCFPAICNRLVVANLSMNDFSGRIDKFFDGCLNLHYLDLSSNKFTGNIWTGFSRLVEFSVSGNFVTGPVPASSFSENCTLKGLDLSVNKFRGELPREISNCQNLVILNLWGNKFTGSIPSELGSISTLEGLLLGDNYFSKVIPESLLNLSNLAVLDLSLNNFGGQMQKVFGRFKQLKYLVLQGNSYTDGLSSSGIHKLTNISRLDLSYNNFSGPLPPEISQMVALDLSFNRLVGSIPPSIGNLRSLLWLMLANNSLTGEIPGELGNCRSLLWLNLANNQLSGRFPHELTNIGRNPTPTFESNRQSNPMVTSPSDCLVTKRLLTIDYSPFGFIYTIFTRKICKNIWDQLLQGHGFFQVCVKGSPVRKYRVSGYLQLSGNLFSGEVPSGVGKMQHLSVLHLGYNHFNGKLPSEIGSLPLVVLNISRNKFSGEIPTEIGNLKCLQNLDLSHNEFSGTFPGNLNSLNELSKFNISFNPQIAGKIPDFGQLATFEEESYLGNPLLQSRVFRWKDPTVPALKLEDENGSKSGEGLWWKALLMEYGCGMTLGMVMLYFCVRKAQPKWVVNKVEAMHRFKVVRPLKKNVSIGGGRNF